MLDPNLDALTIIADREREALAVARAAQAAGRSRGLRAGFASLFARLALALHRDAATDTAASRMRPQIGT